ncbi:hypothetical protein [Streptomyces violaceusniger]|uniref:ATP dependent DNA ligase n=1 Tax=Streptomyces violaceusniger TaxID=68280 RepID=UPI000995F337|nr:hypothetical protein [Streptomyces violaceusniger]
MRRRASPPRHDACASRAGERSRWRSTEAVRSEPVAEIAFTERTRDGRLRHPRYQGLRRDKSARDAVRE